MEDRRSYAMKEAFSVAFDGGSGRKSSSVSVSVSVSGSTDSLNGLKFGKKIYFEDLGSGVPAKQGDFPAEEGDLTASRASSTTSSSAPLPPGHGKKGKGLVQSGQPPRCQVEGCKVDLTGAKPYYCRHKVCAIHSKSPKLIVAGLEQRFCQQCSRFHELSAFDQGKRSCRRRLAGHNERRRKPPPEDSRRAGTFLMDFTHPRFPREVWPTIRAGDRIPSSQATAAAGKFLPYPLQSCPDPPSSEPFSHTGHLYLQNPAGGSVFPSPELSPGEFFPGVSDSGCALSLLSPQPWGHRNRTSGFTSNNVLNQEGTPMAQPANPSGINADKFPIVGSQWPSPLFPFSGVAPEQISAARAKVIGSFRGNEASGSHLEIQHEVGFRHGMPESASSQFPGEFELVQQGSRQFMEVPHLRGYGSSNHQMHWPP